MSLVRGFTRETRYSQRRPVDLAGGTRYLAWLALELVMLSFAKTREEMPEDTVHIHIIRTAKRLRGELEQCRWRLKGWTM